MRYRLTAVVVGALLTITGCGGEDDAPEADEPEIGDTEVVPGEGGPVE